MNSLLFFVIQIYLLADAYVTTGTYVTPYESVTIVDSDFMLCLEDLAVVDFSLSSILLGLIVVNDSSFNGMALTVPFSGALIKDY